MKTVHRCNGSWGVHRGWAIAPRETRLHSFIVKVWSEATEEKTESWRGHITHVPSGKRLYFADLDKIGDFIAGYLAEMGVVLKPGTHRWFRR